MSEAIRCRGFGVSRPFRRHFLEKGRAAWYRVFCFDCRWEEEVHGKASAERAGKRHLRERRAAS